MVFIYAICGSKILDPFKDDGDKNITRETVTAFCERCGNDQAKVSQWFKDNRDESIYIPPSGDIKNPEEKKLLWFLFP